MRKNADPSGLIRAGSYEHSGASNIYFSQRGWWRREL